MPEGGPKLWDSQETLAKMTACLSAYALLQLLRYASYSDTVLTAVEVVSKVEEYIQNQLGEDVVEFKNWSICARMLWALLASRSL